MQIKIIHIYFGSKMSIRGFRGKRDEIQAPKTHTRFSQNIRA